MTNGTGRLGTGRFDEAAIKAAQEAAKKAAAAAAKAAAEAAAKRAAEAAAKKAAQEAAKRTQQGTGELTEARKADFGNLPWEKADVAIGAAAGAVGAITSTAGFTVVRNSLSVQKKVQDIQKTVSTVQSTIEQVKKTGGNLWERLSEKKPPSVRDLKTLDKINGVIRVTGGVQSALKLKDDIKNVLDGDITVRDATTLAKDGLNTLRGADEAVKLFQGTTKGFLGKLAPGIGIAASAADAVHRIDQLSNWNDLSTQDKVANVAYLLGDVADIAGNAFPPAKALGAGLALVGMAAENWDTVKAVGGKIASGAATAARAVGEAADRAVDAVADRAREAVSDVADTAKKVTGAVADGIKKVFGGL